jgi:hypothetical protein
MTRRRGLALRMCVCARAVEPSNKRSMPAATVRALFTASFFATVVHPFASREQPLARKRPRRKRRLSRNRRGLKQAENKLRRTAPYAIKPEVFQARKSFRNDVLVAASHTPSGQPALGMDLEVTSSLMSSQLDCTAVASQRSRARTLSMWAR